MTKFNSIISTTLFNGAPIETISESFKCVGEEKFLLAATEPNNDNAHFFGINKTYFPQAEYVILVLGNDNGFLKLPTAFLKQFSLYEAPGDNRYLMNVLYDEETAEYVFFEQKSPKEASGLERSIICTQFFRPFAY